MADHDKHPTPATTAVAPTVTEVPPTKPIAAEGEGSMTGVSMGLYSAGAVPKVEGEPVDYAANAEAAAAYIVSPMPVMMSDADALIVGRSVEARYIPPPPPPSVIEQLTAMAAPPDAPPPEGGALDASAAGQRAAYGATPPITPQRDAMRREHPLGHGPQATPTPHPAPAPAPVPPPPHRP
jgi:hypothetical protein